MEIGFLLIIGSFVAPALVLFFGDMRYQADCDRALRRKWYRGDE